MFDPQIHNLKTLIQYCEALDGHMGLIIWNKKPNTWWILKTEMIPLSKTVFSIMTIFKLTGISGLKQIKHICINYIRTTL